MVVSSPPNLITLGCKPSWHNRAGRVDRSACLELRASELGRIVLPESWKVARTFKRKACAHREAIAPCQVTATLLLDLHSKRQPRPLEGDYRTQKSNAMKNDAAIGVQRRPGPDHGLPGNPNRGASRTKLMSIPTDWSQTITLERWRHNPRLVYNYVLCPQCNQRKKKLFLVQCTQQELEDTLLVQLWLETHHNPNKPLSEAAAKLIKRYHHIFQPRTLQCGPCLSLRYGQANRTSPSPT